LEGSFPTRKGVQCLLPHCHDATDAGMHTHVSCLDYVALLRRSAVEVDMNSSLAMSPAWPRTSFLSSPG